MNQNSNDMNNTQQVAPNQNVQQPVNNAQPQNNTENVETLTAQAPVTPQQPSPVVAGQTPSKPQNTQSQVAQQSEVVPQPNPQPTEQQTKSTEPTPDNNNNNNNNNKGPSLFAKIMTILLFGGLFAFVYYLSDITEYINQRKVNKQIEELSSGKLRCTANKDSDKLSTKIEAYFTFENRGIISLAYKETITGDKKDDKEELNKLNSDCKKLREEVEKLEGVNVICSQESGVITIKQDFEYSKIDEKTLKSSYSEAGGVYPEFKYKEDINRVENKMTTSDFQCEKSSS